MEKILYDERSTTVPSWLPLTKRLASGGVIIAYHGITVSGEGANATVHVPLQRVAATLRAIRQVAILVPLWEILARHARGQTTKGLVAITFDDAYRSVQSLLWPLLAGEGVPVTLFVVADSLRDPAPFWWDRIDRVAELASATRWRAFEEECGLPAAYRLGQPPEMGSLRPFRQWMLAEHRGRWPVHLEAPLARFEQELGCEALQRPMSGTDLEELAADPLVDIGVHTVSHPVLPLLSDDELRREINAGHRALRERFPRTIPVLAHPFGLYDARTVRIAVEEGMAACLGLSGKQIGGGVPSNLLPRFCMTSRHQPWKVALYALGFWYGIRPRRRGPHRYPALPSPTS